LSLDALPVAIRQDVEQHLEEVTGRGLRVLDARSVGGGSINRSARLEMEDGEKLFLKWNERAPAEMFAAEADGLRALAEAAPDPLRIPEVLATGDPVEGSASWILMEFVQPGRGGPGWAEALGRTLAELHEPVAAACGWRRANFIGSLPQANPSGEDWGTFYRDHRIAPVLRAARARGHLVGDRSLDDLVERIPEILGGSLPDGPSLLHGDLWGGNVFPDTWGRPVLVDPAVYRGDPEVDLAMSELFGFPSRFQPAYRESRPVDGGYERFRRDLYQLYYLLVHVTLFGSGYEAACLRAARHVLGVT
jgi:protein-ribulosamine 3-kinase